MLLNFAAERYLDELDFQRKSRRVKCQQYPAFSTMYQKILAIPMTELQRILEFCFAGT